ncbi:hypothetical protein BD626DRAFT_469578 [Schizophyllum amplum]|uniref:Uncharacterized protein n=1 Tax=Schizophyllum amplum TaxID=97359 RepID=A0A550BS86_9AGAR|nr:hypothetical protein BD626DRAFT_469578 [Auriculariopsis ampla]
MTEMLEGYRTRCDALGVSYPALSVVDNCCTVGAHIKEVFPDAHIALDIWHFLMRYLAVIVDGTRNPNRVHVAHDITNALMKTKASDGVPATYFDCADQVMHMENMFAKWDAKGGVWNSSAAKASKYPVTGLHCLLYPQVHRTQLAHVQKGCLARPGLPAGVAADGSRIEASHKGWNSLQRSFSSGLPMMNALCHDFVLRRNLRILCQGSRAERGGFIASTEGSHHIRLVSHANAVWNSNIKPSQAPAIPILRIVASGEKFGLVRSKVAESFDGLWKIKEETDTEPKLEDLGSQQRPASLFLRPTGSYSPQASTTMPVSTSYTAITTPASSQSAASVASAVTSPLVNSAMAPTSLAPASTTFANADVATPLPLVRNARSRSELLFLHHTSLDPLALVIKGDVEFYLFMDMRAEEHWITYKMTSKHWIPATEKYNERLRQVCLKSSSSYTPKNPRALFDKLAEIEPQILKRLNTGDYTSRSGQGQGFWKRHCFAVDLLSSATSSAQGGVTKSGADRKKATCARCKLLMYPGGPAAKELNHKKGYCLDGGKSKSKEYPDVPPYPQPAGIFEDGVKFYGIRFLQAVRSYYERFVIQCLPPASGDAEDVAFGEMLTARIKRTNDVHPDGFTTVLFPIYTFTEFSTDTPRDLIVQHPIYGQCLRVDSLSDESTY